MGIRTRRIETHWNYLLAIERDLETLSRYIEFDERNFRCFSLEIARVILAAGAEVDVVCKQICKMGNPQSSADNILKYRDEIRPRYPGIARFRVSMPRFGLTLHPWEEWEETDGVPLWWTAYNKIKHHRDSDYEKASLKNALNAVAALFVVVLYLYRDKAQSGELTPSPQVLRPAEAHFGGVTHGGSDFGISYVLD